MSCSGRTSSDGDDSNSKTIEFLRARLLAERSVSKTARERADELEKRVAELDEKLKGVSSERATTEKKMAEIVVALENARITNVSEFSDLSSDYNPSCDSLREERSYDGCTNLERGKHEAEEHPVSPHPGKSLSWKGRESNPTTPQKHNNSSLKKLGTFASSSSSPKHGVGKSCRQLRGKVLRMRDEKVLPGGTESSNCVTSSEGSPVRSDSITSKVEILGGEEKTSSAEQSCSDNTDAGQFPNHVLSEAMEMELQNKFQLAKHYETMEKDQREWEERFGKSKNSPPGSCDCEIHLDKGCNTKSRSAHIQEPKSSRSPPDIPTSGAVSPSHELDIVATTADEKPNHPNCDVQDVLLALARAKQFLKQKIKGMPRSEYGLDKKISLESSTSPPMKMTLGVAPRYTNLLHVPSDLNPPGHSRGL